jgi:hypothetical protein
MPQGPGKYDDVATIARHATNAQVVVLIVLGGREGSGFSVQAPLDISAKLPVLLRQVANEIEASL